MYSVHIIMIHHMNTVLLLLSSFVSWTAYAETCPNIGNGLTRTTDAGQNCFLPFKYLGKWYCDCSPEGTRPWCNVERLYSSDKWGYCSEVTRTPVKTESGKDCKFPHFYGGMWFWTCTTAGRSRPWCPTRLAASVGKDIENCDLVECSSIHGPCEVHLRYRDQCVEPVRNDALANPQCTTTCKTSDILADRQDILCKDYCFRTSSQAPVAKIQGYTSDYGVLIGIIVGVSCLVTIAAIVIMVLFYKRDKPQGEKPAEPDPVYERHDEPDPVYERHDEHDPVYETHDEPNDIYPSPMTEDPEKDDDGLEKHGMPSMDEDPEGRISY